MRTNLSTAMLDYLDANLGVDVREAVYITGKDRSTGLPASVGLWAGLDTVTFTLIDGETGAEVTRDYTGSGTLLSISAIPLTNDFTIQTVKLTLSGVSDAVALAVRQYEPRLAKVDIHRICLDLGSGSPIDSAPCHFFGRCNDLDITDPVKGNDATIEMDVTSYLREATRTNPAKRSDESQKLRSSDRFRRYSGTAYQAQIFWGESKK